MLYRMGKTPFNLFEVFTITLLDLRNHPRFRPRIFDGEFIEESGGKFNRRFEFTHLKIAKKVMLIVQRKKAVMKCLFDAHIAVTGHKEMIPLALQPSDRSVRSP